MPTEQNQLSEQNRSSEPRFGMRRFVAGNLYNIYNEHDDTTYLTIARKDSSTNPSSIVFRLHDWGGVIYRLPIVTTFQISPTELVMYASLSEREYLSITDADPAGGSTPETFSPNTPSERMVEADFVAGSRYFVPVAGLNGTREARLSFNQGVAEFVTCNGTIDTQARHVHTRNDGLLRYATMRVSSDISESFIPLTHGEVLQWRDVTEGATPEEDRGIIGVEVHNRDGGDLVMTALENPRRLVIQRSDRFLEPRDDYITIPDNDTATNSDKQLEIAYYIIEKLHQKQLDVNEPWDVAMEWMEKNKPAGEE